MVERGAFARVVARAALIAVLLAPAAARGSDWRQLPGSTLAFAGEYDGEVFAGRFPEFRTTLTFDPSRPQDARLDVVIPLSRVDTGSAERDETLRGEAFFAVAAFPSARFTASGFRPLGEGRYVADGQLSLRGVRAPVTLHLTWHPGERPVLEGRASVSRLRFGVGGADWADTALMPDAVAVSTRVVFDAR